MNGPNPTPLAAAIATMVLAATPHVMAVGNGLPFDVDEGAIPDTRIHAPFEADSLDFTYHACVEISDQNPNFIRVMRETGYFWVSSYQDEDSVVDSQINYFDDPIPDFLPFADDNGYRIYAKYHYLAGQPNPAQPSLTGTRLSYVVLPQDAYIELYVDPDSDTELELTTDCSLSIEGDSDDALIGMATTVAQGEKTETNGLANGDFEIVFDEWDFETVYFPDPAGEEDDEAGGDLVVVPPGSYFSKLVFNGNVTLLDGPLNDDHGTQGSGNVFWIDYFEPFQIRYWD